MPEPSPFDDDWAELARELERDKPVSPPPASHVEPPAEPAGVNDGLVVGDEALDEFDDAGIAGEAEPSGDAAPGEGQPGTGRKRRRRRRRRRKGAGQTAEVGSADEAEESDKGEVGEGEGEESDVEVGEADTEYGSEQVEEEFEELEMVSEEESEEDTGGELLRELIANWNVPSWDEVVSGLYRP